MHYNGQKDDKLQRGGVFGAAALCESCCRVDDESQSDRRVLAMGPTTIMGTRSLRGLLYAATMVITVGVAVKSTKARKVVHEQQKKPTRGKIQLKLFRRVSVISAACGA